MGARYHTVMADKPHPHPPHLLNGAPVNLPPPLRRPTMMRQVVPHPASQPPLHFLHHNGHGPSPRIIPIIRTIRQQPTQIAFPPRRSPSTLPPQSHLQHQHHPLTPGVEHAYEHDKAYRLPHNQPHPALPPQTAALPHQRTSSPVPPPPHPRPWPPRLVGNAPPPRPIMVPPTSAQLLVPRSRPLPPAVANEIPFPPTQRPIMSALAAKKEEHMEGLPNDKVFQMVKMMRGRIAQLKNEKLAVVNEKEVLESEKDKLTKEVQNLRADTRVATFATKIVELQKQNVALQARLAAEATKNADKLKEMSTTLEDKSSEVAKSFEEVAQLTRRLREAESSKKDIERMRAEIIKLRDEKRVLESLKVRRAQALEADREKLSSGMARVEKEKKVAEMKAIERQKEMDATIARTLHEKEMVESEKLVLQQKVARLEREAQLLKEPVICVETAEVVGYRNPSSNSPLQNPTKSMRSRSLDQRGNGSNGRGTPKRRGTRACPAQEDSELVEATRESSVGSGMRLAVDATHRVQVKVEEMEESVRGAKRKADMMGQSLECVVCLADDVKKEIMFMPCSHMATCETCSERLKDCPMCRTPIKERVKVKMV